MFPIHSLSGRVLGFGGRTLKTEKKIAKYTMKPEQSRRYDEYYTNTTLSNLYKDINSIKSLDIKSQNYEDNDKNLSLNSEEVASTSTKSEPIFTSTPISINFSLTILIVSGSILFTFTIFKLLFD